MSWCRRIKNLFCYLKINMCTACIEARQNYDLFMRDWCSFIRKHDSWIYCLANKTKNIWKIAKLCFDKTTTTNFKPSLSIDCKLDIYRPKFQQNRKKFNFASNLSFMTRINSSNIWVIYETTKLNKILNYSSLWPSCQVFFRA